LTRRLIDAFPEDQLFTFSVGGMRPFGAMAMELIGIAALMVRGVATENWDRVPDSGQRLSKDDVLRLWDESTEIIDRLWAQIRPERFQETATAFGQYPGRVYDLLLYAIDNEIHHRGQGYVYLRAPRDGNRLFVNVPREGDTPSDTRWRARARCRSR
jgi:hypothetical protein